MIRKDVVNHIKQCLTCQQAKHPAGNPFYPLQSINSSNFNDLVQFDHLKLCKTESVNTGLLVIIDHFTNFAEAFPCALYKYDAQTTAKIILNKWFARHGTPARMQSDNATNFTAKIVQELMKASQFTKVTSTPPHTPEVMDSSNDRTELCSPCFEFTRHAECKTGMNISTECCLPTTRPDMQPQDFRRTCSNMAQEIHSTVIHTLNSQREDSTPKKNL